MKFLAIMFISVFVLGACSPDREPEQTATAPAPAPAPPPAPAPAEPANKDTATQDRAEPGKTAFDQGESEADRTITQNLRKSIVENEQFSTSAKNVTIVTSNGEVTLRGQVQSDTEKKEIEKRAQQIAGVKNVQNNLQVTN